MSTRGVTANLEKVAASDLLDPSQITARERYELMTSLVAPRPIGWLSTWGESGIPNLAPFSYFGALSVSPMLVGVSIGERRDGLKDTLVNIRHRGAFCANVVSASLLVPMNESSLTAEPDVDEFVVSGLHSASSSLVDAPFVSECPAVFECIVQQEVDLRGAPNVLIIGEVVGVRLSPDLDFEDGSLRVRPETLRPVGRLGGSAYSVVDVVQRVKRPDHR